MKNMSSSFLRGIVSKLVGQRMVVIAYHRVLYSKDALFPDIIDRFEFEEQIKILKKYFNVMRLDDAVVRLQHGTLPDATVCITFDDGYLDNYEVALPLLKKHCLPATFFVATGFIGNGMMWNDSIIELVRSIQSEKVDLSDIGLPVLDVSSAANKRKAIDLILNSIKYDPFFERSKKIESLCEGFGWCNLIDMMMNEAQIRELSSAGMEIGAHTVNHPILSRVSDEDAEKEICDSKADLENILSHEVTSFAYPNGRYQQDFGDEHINIVKNVGFNCSVSTDWAGVAGNNVSMFRLPRVGFIEKSKSRFIFKLIKSFYE